MTKCEGSFGIWNHHAILPSQQRKSQRNSSAPHLAPRAFGSELLGSSSACSSLAAASSSATELQTCAHGPRFTFRTFQCLAVCCGTLQARSFKRRVLAHQYNVFAVCSLTCARARTCQRGSSCSAAGLESAAAAPSTWETVVPPPAACARRTVSSLDGHMSSACCTYVGEHAKA